MFPVLIRSMTLNEGTKALNRVVPSFTVPGVAAQYQWSHGHAAIRFRSDSGVRDFHFLELHGKAPAQHVLEIARIQEFVTVPN